MKTFVKFSKVAWPKKAIAENQKKGGTRQRDFYYGYFVVGGPRKLAAPLSTADHPDASEPIHWDMWVAGDGVRCGSLINWPHCKKDVPGQALMTLTSFLKKEQVVPSWNEADKAPSGQLVYVLVRMDRTKRSVLKEFAEMFSFIGIDEKNNRKENIESIKVTSEKQAWLAQRAVDVVVLTWSGEDIDSSSLNILQPLFEKTGKQVTAHIFPPDFDDIPPHRSISRCKRDGAEQAFAITEQSAGYGNRCDVELDDLLEVRVYTQNCEEPMDFDTMELDHSNEGDDDNLEEEMRTDALMEDLAEDEPSVASFRVRRVCENPQALPLLRKTSMVLSTATKILGCTEDIQGRQCKMERRIENIDGRLREEASYRSKIQEATEMELRKQYGLYSDSKTRSEMMQKLKKIIVNQKPFASSTISRLARLPWLLLYMQPENTQTAFFRCALCNRAHATSYNPQSDFAKCSRQQQPVKGRGMNFLGFQKSLCIRRFDAKRDKSIYFLRRAITRHAESDEHRSNMKDFYIALGASDRDAAESSLRFTITSTLAAYTIAKQGLPLSTQFPMMLYGLRTGANVGTAHYEKTSAKRMIKTFAVHLEYDLLEYIMNAELPFSLLMDGSSSNRGTKWMSYLLRTLTTENTPFTFHLLFAELRQETAEIIVSTLVDHFKEISDWQYSPGLPSDPMHFVMRHLVALGTDGANVMKGGQGGVYALLENEMKKATVSDAIPRTHLLLSICNAHKLQNAMKNVKHAAYVFARSLVMEMHAIFGTTQGTTARRVYRDTARLMGIPYLQMGAFFEVRWTDSFRALLRSVLRVYPVLIQSLDKLADTAPASAIQSRAKFASWIMRDGRVYVSMLHVLAVLDEVSSLSLYLQQADSLMVDSIDRVRSLLTRLKSYDIVEEVIERLTTRSPLRGYDAADPTHTKNLDRYFWINYYTPPRLMPESLRSSNLYQLGYHPKKFADFNSDLFNTFNSEEKKESTRLCQFTKFRPLDLEATEAQMLRSSVDLRDTAFQYHQEDCPGFDVDDCSRVTFFESYQEFLSALQTAPIATFMKSFNKDCADNITFRFSGNDELPRSLFVSVSKHIILDIIDFNGDYLTEFHQYVPVDATRKNRGYPDYIRAGDEYDTQVRKLQMAESTMLLSKYCAIPDLTPHLNDFYSKLSSNVRRIGGWPSNLRDDKSSVRLYKALLDNADSLDMPPQVKQLFRCVMVLPASNGDPERTFSTANRLTSGYRSSFSAKTLNSILHIQRNGPSLLSVDPAKLAMQWTDPRDGLGLRKHHRSHRGNEYSLMHDVKSAFMENKLNKMDGIKNILESSKDYDSVFKMIGGYKKHNTYCDSPSTIRHKREKTISDEISKSKIFSIGIDSNDD